MNKILTTFLALLWMLPQAATAKGLKLSRQQMDAVVRIATDISLLQPHLDQAKYFQFALAIHRASERYQVDPKLLISIAQQETSFRDDLPEGRHGEHGICQIRKNWLQDHRFIKAFGRVNIKRLRQPENSFMYAAWIINGLKKTKEDRGRVPFWTYYNANSFKHRHRYYLRVNRYLAQLKLRGKSRLLASVKYSPKEDSSEIKGNIRDVVAKITPITQKKFLRPKPKTAYLAARPKREPALARTKRSTPLKVQQASAGGWISAAVEALNEKRSKDSQKIEKNENLRKVSYSSQVRRTAEELGISLQ